MKKLAVILCVMLALGETACNSSNTKEQTKFISAPVDTTPKQDFSDVVFATQKDTTCGMPLRYGIGDTLHFNGKVYGFCSKGCKDAFVEKLKKEKKL
ncbi:MAG TPA: hypothetical protein VHB70_19640 [Parafilimonas sp.]|nr:hypothetical protein [Parafilimonas sp.]